MDAHVSNHSDGTTEITQKQRRRMMIADNILRERLLALRSAPDFCPACGEYVISPTDEAHREGCAFVEYALLSDESKTET